MKTSLKKLDAVEVTRTVVPKRVQVLFKKSEVKDIIADLESGLSLSENSEKFIKLARTRL